jgi:hypothetical protein
MTRANNRKWLNLIQARVGRVELSAQSVALRLSVEDATQICLNSSLFSFQIDT